MDKQHSSMELEKLARKAKKVTALPAWGLLYDSGGFNYDNAYEIMRTR